jgi:1,4-dihydroxy-2-naphthoyl-CoA hydrolase
MRIWKRDFNLEKANQRAKNSMGEFLGIELIEVGDDYVTGRMTINERTLQPFGIMHGGASCTLAESLGSIAAYHCINEDQYCVGLDINTNHIRTISSGFVYGTAKPFHIGKSTHVWGINIVNEEQKLISVSRLTVAVLNQNKT